MISWKQGDDLVIIVECNGETREMPLNLEIDQEYAKRYESVEAMKKIMLEGILKWYGHPTPEKKETIETFLYLNGYCKEKENK